jgi:hypothetical protein
MQNEPPKQWIDAITPFGRHFSIQKYIFPIQTLPLLLFTQFVLQFDKPGPFRVILEIS